MPMKILVQEIHHIRPGKWQEFKEQQKKAEAIERRTGFPSYKYYRCLMGGHDSNTCIIQIEFESFAAMEAAYEKVMADPEFQALGKEGPPIEKGLQIELYTPFSIE
jgi:quinol monooxygenase YgiN